MTRGPSGVSGELCALSEFKETSRPSVTFVASARRCHHTPPPPFRCKPEDRGQELRRSRMAGGEGERGKEGAVSFESCKG